MRSSLISFALIMVVAGCGDDAPMAITPDAGSLDAGSLDAGSLDAGSLDAGSLDAGSLDAGPLGCPAPPMSVPAWTGPIPTGVALTTTAYGFTGTGLADAVTAAKAISGPPFDLFYGMNATGVRVLAVEEQSGGVLPEGVRYMIVADGEAVMEVDVSSIGLGLSDPSPLPGDRLNITLQTLALSFGTPQIAEILGWMADSVVSSGNSVYYRESTGVELDVSTPEEFGTLSSDLHWLHHLYGEVISGPTSCGGSYDCWELRHGGPSGPVVTIRDRDTAPFSVGDCVELYAPLSQFTGDPQFELWQYHDSYRVYPTP